MAITFIQQKKRRRYFIIALLAVVVIGALFLGIQFLPRGATFILPVVGIASPFEKDININFEILDSPVLKELGNPPEPIPLPDSSKRANPFTPL